MIVMKFGGTSVGDAGRIEHVAGLIRQAPARPVVVVSAMAGVTNSLIELARLAASGQRARAEETLAALREKHAAVARELLQAREQEAAVRFIEDRVKELSTLVESLAVLGELTLRALDRIAGMGEKFAAYLLAAVLRSQGADAAYVDATEVLVTDSSFGGANPLMAETRARAQEKIRPLLEAGKIPVITGYIGADAAGTPTTLGRGGGDYSAAIFGAALDADEVWIWTDVDGILTADPKIVPAARTLEELTYVEAAQLAYFGAEVLHPKTVQPLVERGIPLRIRNTFNPEHPGTRIVRQRQQQGSPARAIITAKNLSMIAVVGSGAGWSPALSARALQGLAQAGVEVLMFGQSFVDSTFSLLVRRAESEDSLNILQRVLEEELAAGIIREISRREPVASVSVVGAGAEDSFSLASRTFAALARQHTEVLDVAQAYSEYNVTFIVRQEDVDAAVRCIHAELGLGA